MNVKEWVEISCQINGKCYQFCVSPAMSLLELLREHGLTSVKQGCCVGECGACSVLIDGVATDSCLYLALWADGKQIFTAEGLGKPEGLSPVQQAYVDAGAVQCGFCTPGLVVATHALLAKPRNRPLTHEEIRRGLSGNLCRCTGYQAIVRAVDACQQATDESSS
ncbi:xanthine dehydrogenase iron sulfur-binding subunit XdhC [Edwardsiella tarda]|uniref:xanthine dehydrogenase iron sulfur-binding subunit XdhC n=1 Tax=Edwardsiella tarda TaxID=636 RepID=UPI000D51C612|nr:xanthine dehydrogenase iron sulfur-binding subunit XdhC [Edwardsiella tarda]UCQ53753.1 xanthine dehydrogenase iron sulfur-binding subunit XdhC [Edwardsiella tarda]